MSKYQQARNTRRYGNARIGRFRGGLLAPVLAMAVRPSEGGVASFGIEMELDPIAGRLATPMYGELTGVFVPVQAIDYLKDPEAGYAGMTEVLREKLLTGNPLFALEEEGEISKRLGINPRSIGGVKKVNEAARLSYIAAVNFLRLRKYHKATLLLHSSTAISPALISQTVLERFNAVLDPDDRINGQVELDLPTIQLPVSGVGVWTGDTLSVEANKVAVWSDQDAGPATTRPFVRKGNDVALETTEDGKPTVFAQLDGVAAGGVSLVDFYNAQKKDGLIRTMDQIIRDNPQFGYEMAARWAHGLSVDAGRIPWVIFERRMEFGKGMAHAMDTEGVEADVKRTDGKLLISGSVPVPKTELGGIIVLMASLKPDETIASQPDPFLSEPWGLDNFVADELALDPQPVTLRDLDSDIESEEESTVAMYTGLNQLKVHYSAYGLSRELDPEDVANKTAIWQLEVPLSVTPDTILYPDELEHYPFADQEAEVVTYKVQAVMTLGTPMIVGPTPVENVEVVDDLNLFDEEE